MNVNQILEELTWRLGNRSDIQARTLTWLNDAYFELLLSPRFAFYQLDRSTPWIAQKDTFVYQLSTMIPGYWFIIDIRNDLYQQKLKKFDPTELDRRWRVPGMPQSYGRFADQIELDPVPDMDYNMTFRWRFRPPELVNGGEHLLTREWDEVITTMAVQKGWEALEQWDKATSQKQIVEVQLARRQSVEDLEAVDHEITVGVAYGWS
jgi:hypothetical protein